MGLGVGEGLGVAVGEGFGVAVGEGTGVAVGDGFGVAVGEGIGVGEGEGVGVGCPDRVATCAAIGVPRPVARSYPVTAGYPLLPDTMSCRSAAYPFFAAP